MEDFESVEHVPMRAANDEEREVYAKIGRRYMEDIKKPEEEYVTSYSCVRDSEQYEFDSIEEAREAVRDYTGNPDALPEVWERVNRRATLADGVFADDVVERCLDNISADALSDCDDPYSTRKDYENFEKELKELLSRYKTSFWIFVSETLVKKEGEL